MRHRPLRRLVIAFAAALPLAALAQQPAATPAAAWPSKPITIVSPYAPGGTNDIPARILAEGFQKLFNQTVIVKNVNGAAGVLGGTEVMRSAPDGHTLLVTNIGAMVVQPVVRTPAPYDPVQSFTPIARLSDAYAFVGVSGDLPVKDVGELVALAKKSPGQLNYGSAGSGSFGNFLGEYFKLLTGTDMVHIPAKGSSAALMEMKAGRVQAMFDPLVLPQSSDGRIKMLAVVSKTRLPNLPDVPTVKEAGGPELGITAWYGLFGPAGMPREVVARLESAIDKVLSEPETRRKMVELGLTPNIQKGDQFRATIEQDLKLFADVKNRARLTVE